MAKTVKKEEVSAVEGPEEKHTSGYYREEFGRVARFYDFGVGMAFRWVGGEVVFRCGIVEAVEAYPGDHVLDIACGTGTLLQLLAACAGPEGRAVGVDMSGHMLEVARRKAAAAVAAGEPLAPLEYIQTNAEDLPFPDASFDRVTASLAIHEMNREGRMNALSQMHRVLKKGGRAVVADMRSPDTPLTRLGMKVVRLVETDTLDDMWFDGLYREMGRAGFRERRRHIAGKGFFEMIVAEK